MPEPTQKFCIGQSLAVPYVLALNDSCGRLYTAPRYRERRNFAPQTESKAGNLHIFLSKEKASWNTGNSDVLDSKYQL